MFIYGIIAVIPILIGSIPLQYVYNDSVFPAFYQQNIHCFKSLPN